MATQINPDGTVTQFVIGQEDDIEIAASKQSKKRGRSKVFNFERKLIGAQIPLDQYNKLMALFSNPTMALNTIVAEYLKQKEG